VYDFDAELFFCIAGLNFGAVVSPLDLGGRLNPGTFSG
jgi:hypothetical protein